MQIIQRFITKNPCYQTNLNPGTDKRYLNFQKRGPTDLMLHSVGCPQPSAENWNARWNKETAQACVQAVIDGNTGEIIQNMPWNFRAWHCGGTGNDTHVGVEMGESQYISYYYLDQFTCSNLPAAQAGAKKAYRAAVELFAYLCKLYAIDPLKHICSHKEGYYKGIASGHRDPEHYWKGLGLSYTMDTFRSDVKNEMEDVLSNMTEERLNEILDSKLDAQRKQFENRVRQITDSFNDGMENMITELRAAIDRDVDERMDNRMGIQIDFLNQVPSDSVRKNFKPLLDEGYVNGGTPNDQIPDDVHLPWAIVRAMTVLKTYVDAKLRSLLTDEAPEGAGGECDADDLESCCPITFPEDSGGGDYPA